MGVRDGRGGAVDERRRLLLACLGAFTILTGVQAILPTLPLLQQALGLSAAQVSFVMSAYLLPSVVLAIPAGLLVDRIGRREVYAAALTVFGLAAIPQLDEPSFLLLITMRMVQGAAFAAVLPLTITLIADVRHGAEHVSAQGLRSVVLSGADALLPALGGLLAGVAWSAPFALQLTCLPVALLAWVWLPPGERSAPSPRPYRADIGGVLREPGIAALQLLGMVRMFLKFAVLTYFPLLAAATLELPPAAVGALLAASALAGTAASALSGRIVRGVGAYLPLVAALLVTAGALAGISVGRGVVLVAGALLAWGAADGLLGVLQGSLAADAAPAAVRGGFIAVTGTARNLGKFLAPLAMGGLVALVPISTAFLLLGAVAGLAVLPLRGINRVPDPPGGAGGQDAARQCAQIGVSR